MPLVKIMISPSLPTPGGPATGLVIVNVVAAAPLMRYSPLVHAIEVFVVVVCKTWLGIVTESMGVFHVLFIES